MNIIPPAHLLAPPNVTHNAGPDVLEACNVASMVGALQQLGLLAQRAHEIFDGLAAEAGWGADRVGRLQNRLEGATGRLARVDDALNAADQEELAQICTQASGIEYHAAREEQSNLFSAASRPPSLQAAVSAARAPPPLGLLDAFVAQPEGGGKYAKYDLHDSCLDGWSDQHFFLKQWLDEEERKVNILKAERKARRAERRAKEGPSAHKGGHTRREAKRVAKKKFLTEEEQLGIDKKTASELLASAQEKVRKKEAAAAEAQAARPPPGATGSGSAPGQPAPGSLEARRAAMQQAQAASPKAPMTRAEKLAAKRAGMISGGDATQQGQKPPPPPPPDDDVIGLEMPGSPRGGALAPPGISPGAGGAPPPPPPPPGGGVPPPPPPPPPPMAAAGGGGGDDRNGLLAAIRGGAAAGLKKAADRGPTQSVSSGDPHNALLSEIAKGRQLRKVVVEQKAPEAPQTMGGLSVAAILARRAALAGSDEESSDDDEWDD